MCDSLYKLKRHLDQRMKEAREVIEQCQSARNAIDEYEKRYSVDSNSITKEAEPILLPSSAEKSQKVSPTEALRQIIYNNPLKEWLHVELEAEIEDMIADGRLSVKEGRKPSLVVYSSLNRLIKNGEINKIRTGNEKKPRFKRAYE